MHKDEAKTLHTSSKNGAIAICHQASTYDYHADGRICKQWDFHVTQLAYYSLDL